jgi:hypothetical protein
MGAYRLHCEHLVRAGAEYGDFLAENIEIPPFTGGNRAERAKLQFGHIQDHESTGNREENWFSTGAA